MTHIYAQHASDTFNIDLHLTLQSLANDVEQVLNNNLVALLLGGGYGRGEGGVMCNNGQEYPYNDLDLTLVVKNKRCINWQALKNICKKYEAKIGIEVDFSRPLTPSDVRHWPHKLMWYDLLKGHKVLAGAPNILQTHAPETLYSPLPPIEATRLLLNRGAGLLWAMRISQGIEAPLDEDFVRRNYYKCALALGDALLITYGRFTTAYQGRDKRLEHLAADFTNVSNLGLETLYHKALHFKFHPHALPTLPPDDPQLIALSQKWGRVFQHVEQLRTDRTWKNLTEYVQWPGIREKDENRLFKWPRNIFQNKKLGQWSWRYPRETLYRQLPILLGLTDIPVHNWAQETSQFLKCWEKFN